MRSILAGMYLCHPCSCQEILYRAWKTPGQAHEQAAQRLGFADVAAARRAAALAAQQQQQLGDGRAPSSSPAPAGSGQPPPPPPLALHSGADSDLHPEAAQRLGACFGAE
jgi:hypothetical protein